ncbi:MAG TPA: stage III sporulation protein AD [Firmicutes bacterium]|uniref:Stage III sporulation protein AD n=1 Tax=Candidatus Fermentithermobacillus carboniphilus TaxID=3085328 RepID=A0AAT9LD04_9FIRM|nr:MAG: stage III sporulation protein AD [Candidatus Fermentithermobacillus carboniphilus]HHW17916.1 stage III sporulation protein AD [Candidatus Fermentithermobacillaceae bacterium]
MEIFGIVAFGIVSSLILLLLRKERPEMALGLSLVSGLLVFFLVLPELTSVISVFSGIVRDSGLEPLYFGVILKVLAISYIADFGAAICRDAGEELMASRVEMAGKLLILISSIPVIQGVMELIKTLLT